MRTHTHPASSRRQHSATAICSLLAIVAGCPNTKATDPSIEQVEAEGDLATTSFRLKVVGRGFGLKSVQFDLSKREGNVEAEEMALQIERSGDVITRIDGVELESPRVLYAAIELSAPLSSATYYDVALLERGKMVAFKEEAFFVPATTSTDTPDAGSDLDADVLAKDGATLDGELRPDAGSGDEDATEPGDADAPDRDPVDVGPPDSGLGPFVGTFENRRLIVPNNTVLAPSGATILIPIDHAAMLTATTALAANGADLAVYQGPDRLDHQWDDQFIVGTDQLVIVARLLRDVPIGGSGSDPLVLYSGDPGASLSVTDSVFEFSERFLSPVGGGWNEAGNWTHCNLDRPIEMTGTPNGSYCCPDVSASNLARSTLGTPAQPNMVAAPGANLTYEMSIWQAGRMIDGAADILYFAYGPSNTVFDNTIDPDLAGYSGFVPNAMLTFTDTDNMPRTVSGWRHPPDAIQWWQRTILRFVPTIDNPTLHFRHISLNANATNNSAADIDDWWIRRALDPDFAPVLGPPEAR